VRGFFYRPTDEPGVGASVEPLGDGLIRLFPEGFSPLACPAAALPALLAVPVPVVPPVAFPLVVPPVGDPVVVPLVAAPPVVELPPAAPPVDCASAQVPVSASAVASPNVASFMVAPFSWCVMGNELRRRCVPGCRSQFVAIPKDFLPAAIWKSQKDAWPFCSGAVRRQSIFHIPTQLKIV
jgi:hypothetical protein